MDQVQILSRKDGRHYWRYVTHGAHKILATSTPHESLTATIAAAVLVNTGRRAAPDTEAQLKAGNAVELRRAGGTSVLLVFPREETRR